MKSRFSYQKRSVDDIKERANNRGGNFDSIFKGNHKIFKPKDGKNIVRILPPTWEKAKHYGYDIYVNYGIGVDNQSYLSLSKMKNERDPIAEARNEASRDGDEKLARALQPTERILMWVVDRHAEEEGPQLWPCPLSVDRAIAAISYDEDTKEVSFVDDPTTGRDFRFYKEGQGMTTKYPAEKMKLLAEAPLHEDEEVANSWLEFVTLNPIPGLLNFYDYAHIEAIFSGHVRSSDDEKLPEKPEKSNGRSRVVDEEVPFETDKPKTPVREPETTERPMSIRERLAARHKATSKSVEAEDD